MPRPVELLLKHLGCLGPQLLFCSTGDEDLYLMSEKAAILEMSFLYEEEKDDPSGLSIVTTIGDALVAFHSRYGTVS